MSPAIIMSGFANDELRVRAKDLWIVGVFDNPFDSDLLRTFVNELFQVQGRR